MKLNEVFGIGMSIMASYVSRAADDEFLRYLKSDRHIVVFGSSKQGKTSLRKKNLSSDRCVTISCQPRWDLTRLYVAILKQAGCEPKLSEEKSVRDKGKISASFSVGPVSFGVGGDKEKETKETYKKFEIDPDDPNDIISALESINFSKWIVLDDFHYLPQETQRDFAAALKAFFDNSNIRFIVIAVWRERNKISSLGDLALRCVAIDADRWLDSELKNVISRGEAALNIVFSDRLKKQIVSLASGSVYIVQEVCLNICQQEEIWETCAEKTKVGHGKSAKPIVDGVINQFSTQFNSFLTNFSQGFQGTELQMFKWILYPLITASDTKLRNGIQLTEISQTLQKYHPKQKELNRGNIAQALKSVSALQAQKDIKPFVLDYDESNRVLNVVDRSFILWLELQDRSDILAELGLPIT